MPERWDYRNREDVRDYDRDGRRGLSLWNDDDRPRSFEGGGERRGSVACCLSGPSWCLRKSRGQLLIVGGQSADAVRKNAPARLAV